MKIDYIKLGDKANFFYDPTSGLKVLPGQVIKVDAEKVKANLKLNKALKSGHLEYADENDYDPEKVKALINELEGNTENISNGSDDEYNHDELVEMAVEAGSTLSKSKLKKKTKDELVAHINELNGEEEVEEA
jgi:hypothetical protein